MPQRHPEIIIPRRRSRLIVGAVWFVILACIASVWLLTRSTQAPIADDNRRDVIEADNERSASIANSQQPIVETDQAKRDQRNVDAGDALPAWARSPGAWTTPFPEGGRYNPPLPPVQLPPGMNGDLSPPAGSDASAPAVGGPGAPPDGGASTDGQQLDVEDDHALR